MIRHRQRSRWPKAAGYPRANRSGACRALGVVIGMSLGSSFSLAFAQDETPAAVFERYQEIVANGRTFDEDKVYYSATRQQEIKERMENRADGSSDVLERMKTRYLEITQNEATCAELTLVQQDITKQRASLRYAVNDICNGRVSGTTEMRIEMIFEDGWKIVENVTGFSE